MCRLPRQPFKTRIINQTASGVDGIIASIHCTARPTPLNTFSNTLDFLMRHDYCKFQWRRLTTTRSLFLFTTKSHIVRPFSSLGIAQLESEPVAEALTSAIVVFAVKFAGCVSASSTLMVRIASTLVPSAN